MNKRMRISIFSLILILALTISLFNTTTAQADDITPPPATEEPVTTSEPIATDDVPTATPEAIATDVPSVAEEAPTEELTASEAMAQLPDGTDLVILDESGETLPLASQEAENIFLSGDPMWCPDGVLPGGIGCTIAHTSFNDLINDLANSFTGPDFTYSGSGTIYVAYNYDASSTNDNGAAIVFDYGEFGLTNLVVQGGWDFGTNTIVGTSTIDGAKRVDFLDWGGWGVPGNLTLNDLIINQGAWLYIGDGTDTTTANVTLDNVTVSNTTFGSYIGTDGNVEVTDSQFDDTISFDGLDVESGGNVKLTRVSANENYGNGLGISSAGSITLTDVIAEYNGENGATLDSCGCTPGGIFVSGGSFSHNDLYGLEAYAEDDVNLIGVTADYNDWGGALLDSSNNIFVDGNSFSHNRGDGLDAEAFGNITLKNITAVDNAYDGASLINGQGSGDISVSNSVFNFNGWDNEGGAGLDIYTNGNISLSFVTASNNTFNGAYVDPTSVTAICSTFDNNGDTGLEVDLAGGTGIFNNVSASGNSVDMNIFNGSYTLGSTDCSPSNNHENKPAEAGCAGETIVLTNEDRLIFQCAEAGHNHEEVLTLNTLPGVLPKNYTFVSGFTVHLILNGVEVMVSPDPEILQFKLPAGANFEDYAILFWNGTDWIEVPGAIVTDDGFLQVSVTQEGTYILVHK